MAARPSRRVGCSTLARARVAPPRQLTAQAALRPRAKRQKAVQVPRSARAQPPARPWSPCSASTGARSPWPITSTKRSRPTSFASNRPRCTPQTCPLARPTGDTRPSQHPRPALVASAPTRATETVEFKKTTSELREDIESLKGTDIYPQQHTEALRHQGDGAT